MTGGGIDLWVTAALSFMIPMGMILLSKLHHDDLSVRGSNAPRLTITRF